MAVGDTDGNTSAMTKPGDKSAEPIYVTVQSVERPVLPNHLREFSRIADRIPRMTAIVDAPPQ
jgi:hypothetical protein